MIRYTNITVGFKRPASSSSLKWLTSSSQLRVANVQNMKCSNTELIKNTMKQPTLQATSTQWPLSPQKNERQIITLPVKKISLNLRQCKVGRSHRKYKALRAIRIKDANWCQFGLDYFRWQCVSCTVWVCLNALCIFGSFSSKRRWSLKDIEKVRKTAKVSSSFFWALPSKKYWCAKSTWNFSFYQVKPAKLVEFSWEPCQFLLWYVCYCSLDMLTASRSPKCVSVPHVCEASACP